ncbi:MAG: BNR/Asp-box repeat protein [bacterium ADurb.Bin429]|nr:MAG: BNR/Asp-box repeat protein [bacterium ADurb.Bin429]
MLIRAMTRETFIPSPCSGIAAHAGSFYTTQSGLDLVSVHARMSRSDTCDVAYQRLSRDNGRTWSPPAEIVTGARRPQGTFRRHLRAGYADPISGCYLTFRTEGILPTDHPLEGMRQWQLHYTVSADGGASTVTDEQIVQEGYTVDHPFPDVFRGKNCVMLGDLTCVPLSLPDGSMLVPAQSSVIGGDGELFNPSSGFTYTDAFIIRGGWRGERFVWTGAARVAGDPARSTRGMIEPTLSLLPDGRVLMVMRGSNHSAPQLPGYRWHAFSEDGGITWSASVPWTWTDGEAFFSPSACSQLLRHSNGALYWIGNISPQNPNSNSPRYPLILAEVDQRTGLLIRDSVSIIDDRRPGEDEALTLSNFYAREDRENGELVLHLSRFFSQAAGDWTADALLYRITLNQ